MIRYRVDGVLGSRRRAGDGQPLPQRDHQPCIKIMANLNIAEKRKPQDGRISLPLQAATSSTCGSVGHPHALR